VRLCPLLPTHHPNRQTDRQTNHPLQTDSILFLLFSLTFIATVLYLPQHLKFVLSRAWFYINGDAFESTAGELVKGVLTSAGRVAEATHEAVKEL
jgi:hypothetical protein